MEGQQATVTHLQFRGGRSLKQLVLLRGWNSVKQDVGDPIDAYRVPLSCSDQGVLFG